MQAKVIFRMRDRSEHNFTVKGDNQGEFYDLALEQLNEKLNMLADIVPGTPPPEFFVFDSWRTIPEISGTPATDKVDGVAVRSSLQKVRFDLLPIAPLVEVAKVFAFGAAQYGDRNWEEGFSWSRCIGAIWRHLMKWCVGEDYDDESKLNHLAHVVANCFFLLQYAITNTGTDDRQKCLLPPDIVELFRPIKVNVVKEESSSNDNRQ